MAHGLSCSAECGILPDQGLNPCPCIGRWILNHCTTREAQKFKILMKCSLSIFSFMDQAFGVISKNSLFNPKSLRCYPIFSSRSLEDLALTFRSLIHFELIFVYDVR